MAKKTKNKKTNSKQVIIIWLPTDYWGWLAKMCDALVSLHDIVEKQMRMSGMFNNVLN